jgi:hypothetical protein
MERGVAGGGGLALFCIVLASVNKIRELYAAALLS